jgi:hypothetical protein
MTPAPEPPLRRLPIPVRPIRCETIGSFLTRLAYANDLRIPHLLDLTAIARHERWVITPATEDHHGWSPSTPHRIAALTGRPLTSLATAFPVVAEFLSPEPATAVTPEARLLRACRHCTAARNITGMVIVRARPHDYLCIRHRLWHHGIGDVDLTAIPEVVDAQRRHNRQVRTFAPGTVAHAHRQAHDVIDGWLAECWHPALTSRWQHRLQLMHAEGARHPSPQISIITHPELLSVAGLLLASSRRHLDLGKEATARLGFPCRPCPRDPLARQLTRHPRQPKAGKLR